MEIKKKIADSLEKCYCVSTLQYQGKQHVLVASEKPFPCRLYDLDGNLEETVWDAPGGTMTICQVPGTDGVFLATHKFYSPNDSKEAKIVIVSPRGKNDWEIRTLVDVPHIHRFDIVKRNGIQYLIACTIKSGCDYKDDWSYPGKVYAAVLPDNLDEYYEGNQLKLQVIMDGMVKNHGYFRIEEDGLMKSVISCESGVYLFTPPALPGAEWEIKKLISQPSSDAVYMDFDGDGEKELLTLSPFHGDMLRIFKKKSESFEMVYEYPEPLEFLHAMWAGRIMGQIKAVVGNRKGSRNLMMLSYDKEKHVYTCDVLDENCGSANIIHMINGAGKDSLVSANREINEIAFYELTK